MYSDLDWASACRTLGVHENASIAEIKRRFRKLAWRYHPDTFITPLDKAYATKRFQPLARAYADLLEAARSRPADVEAAGSATSQDFHFEAPEETVSMWTILEPFLTKHPSFTIVLDFIMLPYIIFMAFAVFPLLPEFWHKYPRLRHSLGTVALRWAPSVLTLLVPFYGISQGRGYLWATAWFITSGVAGLTLEAIAQLSALRTSRQQRDALAIIMSEAADVVDMV